MMQVADNQAVGDVETAELNGQGAEPSPEPGVSPEPSAERETTGHEREATSTVDLAGKRVGRPFQPGNQLWRRRGKAPGLQTSRRALREAFHKALTPDKMAACVAKMLAIIDDKDAKAAVQAFKVLTECAGIRGESDSTRSGPSFTFILPERGAIPDRPGPPVVIVQQPSTGETAEPAGLLTDEPAES